MSVALKTGLRKLPIRGVSEVEKRRVDGNKVERSRGVKGTIQRSKVMDSLTKTGMIEPSKVERGRVVKSTARKASGRENGVKRYTEREWRMTSTCEADKFVDDSRRLRKVTSTYF